MSLATEPQSGNLSGVLIPLLRGVIYREQHPKLWQGLQNHQAALIDYLRVMNLELMIDEAEGYAYLHQGAGEENGESLPRLIQRRPLSYPVSLLCVLLRKKLVEADSGVDDARSVITKAQIVETLRTFLPVQSNETRVVDQIDTHINKVIELGFLRRLSSEQDTFEIRRIIKALVDADWLADLDGKLEHYRAHAEPIA